MKVMVGNNYGSYTFVPGTAGQGTITLNNLPLPLEPGQLTLIVNAVVNKFLFNLADPNLTAVVSGNVITLATDTSMYSSTDPLQIFMEVPTPATPIAPSYDGKILDTPMVSSPGPGIAYNTTGYQKISFQFNGQWQGNINIEASLDQQSWFLVQALNTMEGIYADTIAAPGIYHVPVVGLYIRYNVQILNMEPPPVIPTGEKAVSPKTVSPVQIIVVGRTNPVAETPLLSQTFDPSTGIQQSVNVAGGLNKDLNNALILSDAPIMRWVEGGIGANIIIDTQGYQSLHVSSIAMGATVSASNDLVVWNAVNGVAVVTAVTMAPTIGANTCYIFPCAGRFMRLAVTAAGSATYYLRNMPAGSTSMSQIVSTNYIGGSAVVNAGVVGVQAIGGNVAPGAARTTSPVPVSGIDPGNLTRMFLTDTGANAGIVGVGRLVTAATDVLNIVRPSPLVAPGADAYNIPPVPVMDLTLSEGQSQVDFLNQILTELKINNYYLYNLPAILAQVLVNALADLNVGTTAATDTAPFYLAPGDEPASLRNEPSALN